MNAKAETIRKSQKVFKDNSMSVARIKSGDYTSRYHNEVPNTTTAACGYRWHREAS